MPNLFYVVLRFREESFLRLKAVKVVFEAIVILMHKVMLGSLCYSPY